MLIFPNLQATRGAEGLKVLQGFASCLVCVLGRLGDAVSWKGGVDALMGWKEGVDALTGAVLLVSTMNCCRNSQFPPPRRKNRCQNWALKPRMEVATKGLVSKSGAG